MRWEKLVPGAAWKFLRKEKGTREYVTQIYPQGDTEEILAGVWGKRIGAVAAILLLAVVLLLLETFTGTSGPAHLRGRSLIRGEDDETIELQVEGVQASSQGERTLREKISVDIGEREFTKAEKKQLSDNVRSYLQKTLPGKNESLEQVTRKLRFVKQIPQSGVTVEWSYDEELLTDAGALRTAHIPQKGLDTEVRAQAVWKNWKENFSFSVHLVPQPVSAEEQALQDIRRSIRGAVKKQADQETIELPEEAGGYALQYAEEEESGISPVYLVLAGIFFLPAIWHQKQKKELADRDSQLILDYPVFMNRVMLLLGAGLTVRGAMERLAGEYRETRQKGGEVRYVYEEVAVMTAHMREGMSESKAIELFGRRCKELSYLRFSSVLTQNLKKGAEGILDILERESLEAMEKRKERILQMGEVAGTKLLFPMMLMLGIVMGIIMVPAFMTM